MRRSLVSLAVVTAMWEQRRHDYLDNFVPFVATLVNARSITRIQRDEIPDLCHQFNDEFGLRLPFRVFRNPGGKGGSPGDADGVGIKATEMKVDGVAESLAVAEAAR